MLNVCIITEGGQKFGFGHIMRCISIYQAFNEKNIIPHFLINADATVNEVIPKSIKYEIDDWFTNSELLFNKIQNRYQDIW